MIYIVRHGQTKLNRSHALQGRSDLPLDETGTEQALTVARELSGRGIAFDHVFSSPLRRAVQTARLICPSKTPQLDDRLLEMDYGPYEGADLKNPTPELRAFFKDFAHAPAPRGMEQLADVVARTGAFIGQVAALEGDILVSTHAIAMKGILEFLSPDSRGAYWSTYIGNCAVYAVEGRDGALRVVGEIA